MTHLLSEEVRDLGLKAGFDAVGFARAEPVGADEQGKVRAWLGDGYHAGMAYMSRNVDLRLDPCRLLPESKTVIVGLSSYAAAAAQAVSPASGVSRYARGRDYHKVVRKILKRLQSALLDRFPSALTRAGVDTAPMLERYWAAKAGLGWIGKNTMFLNQQFGSWCFIGFLLTSLEIEPDQPSGDHCGHCTRCLEHCPTEAFPEPGNLDSRRCISYWTIEHRGEFTPRVQALVGNWVFGCDRCQEVCPWNSRTHRCVGTTSESNPVDYLPHPWFVTGGIDEWLHWNRDEWDLKTRGTALRRAGYEGWVRNCSAVHVNIKSTHNSEDR